MSKITLITVGNLKEEYLKSAYSEYKKRLSQFARVDEINIKEEVIKNENDESEIERALDSEGDKILSLIPKDAFVFSMCVEGREYESVSLAKKIESALDNSGKLVFIIGSSHGLSKKVKDYSHERLSISKLTFPHQLMRVLLSEVLYRSFTIINGKKYHK